MQYGKLYKIYKKNLCKLLKLGKMTKRELTSAVELWYSESDGAVVRPPRFFILLPRLGELQKIGSYLHREM